MHARLRCGGGGDGDGDGDACVGRRERGRAARHTTGDVCAISLVIALLNRRELFFAHVFLLFYFYLRIRIASTEEVLSSVYLMAILMAVRI